MFLGAVALIGLQFTEPLVAIFQDDPKVIEIGVVALAAQFAGQIFQPLAVCANMLFQSVGKTGIATLLSMLRSGLFFLPVLLILSALFELAGVQYAQAIADVLTCIVALPFVIHFLGELKKKEAEAASLQPLP